MNILSSIHHNRLVQFYGACLDSVDKSFVVMEYMSKGSLFDCLHGSNEENKIPKEKLLMIAIQCAEGVAFMHSRKPPLIHRGNNNRF